MIAFLTLVSGRILCSVKKVTCPSFTDPFFDQWFSYTQYTIVRFKGPNREDRVNFWMQTAYESPSYETSQGGYGNNVAFCEALKDLIGRSSANTNQLFDIRYSKNECFANGQNGYRLNVQIEGSTWVAQQINNNSISPFGNKWIQCGRQ